MSIPFRERSESLASTAALARHLADPADRAVARHLAVEAATAGMRTCGQLLDHIEALGPQERRRLLDHARADCGLPTTGEIEESARIEMANTAARVRMATDRRPLRLGLRPGGGFVDLNAEDDERQRIEGEQASRRRQHEERLAVAQIESEALRQSERARDAAANRELPPHLRAPA